ncbi:MAG: PQQ-binding-like beta-propeller repeat protein, partial [Verrucomicrobiota bacterium]
AWVWNSPDDALKPQLKASLDRFKATPLMVDGVLYVRSSLSIALAIDAETGNTLWGFNSQSYKWGRPASYGYTTRGLAYWKAAAEQRLFLATGDAKLFALDPRTGTSIKTFGKDGFVDLTQGLHRSIKGLERMMNYSGPPVVCRDVVIIGSIVGDGMGHFRGRKVPIDMPPGDVRAYDVRTGKLRWRFNTIPQAGEAGVETWEDESWKWVGGCNVWSIMSADEALGYVYLPVTAPSSNYYGGFRPGDNRYGQSLVCVDVMTGKRVWHFQTVHHPVWDMDLPAAPNLVDIEVDGKTIKAVALVSKTGFTYVFDRVTGEPVWPIEERPVATDGVPGETLAKTQPFPSKPPAFDRQGISDDDLLDFTPGIKAEARKLVSRYRVGPLFTPLTEKGTLILPGIGGGGDWPGAAFDPDSGMLYVPSKTVPTLISLIKQGPKSPWPIKYREEVSFPRVRGMPVVKPPWGRITAIDLNRGEIAWQRANSDGLRHLKSLKALKLPPTGNAHKFNLMVTKSLLFSPISGRGVFDPDGSPAPSRLRALDKKSGEVIWQHPLTPSYNGGGPMSYLWKGRQYIVVPTGGGNQTSHLVAFRLKRKGDPELTGKLPAAPVRRELPTEVKGTVSASEAAGFKVYQARCMGCHTIGNGPLLGPDLLGSHTKPVEVLTAMTRLMRLTRNVEISDEEVKQVVDFLRREDAPALLYAK